MDDSLVEALLRPSAFDHDADDIELVETHISWVVLAGDYAYKIKKPLVLDFVDFGSLEKRRHSCEEEVRLNGPWAPDIYLDVVAVTGPEDAPVIDGDGDVLEYAVKMRRFDQSLRLDRQLAGGLLTPGDMKELGRNIAERHDAADRPDGSERERLVRQAIRFMRENFEPLEGVVDDDDLAALRDWTERAIDKYEPLMWQRFDDGFVRDCHGDLHLGNLVRLTSGITTFDCIEFNPDLRYTDVWADVGFLVMDLAEKDRADLAAHFLNRYLERTGDYDGAVLLDLYFVYRCLVRAKVAAIRGRERDTESERDKDFAEARDYCAMAKRQISKGAPALVIMCGLSGSGKTWLSERLMAAIPAIRIRSDIERKRMAGLDETAESGSGVGTGLYAPEMSERVYRQLREYAAKLLAARHHVILDAAFLAKDQRDAARDVAARAGVASVLVHVDAPKHVLEDRIRQRSASGSDASESDLAVLEHQLETAALPSPNESPVVVDTSRDVDIAQLVSAIKAKRITTRDGDSA